jgi:hypothetical protein
LEVADQVELLFLLQAQLVVTLVFLMVLLLLHQTAEVEAVDIILLILPVLVGVAVEEELDLVQPAVEQQH